MRILFLAVAALVLVACDVKVTGLSIANRSGPTNDDFVEEPLVPGVVKYERALEVSNAFLDSSKKGDYAGICAQYLAPPLDTQLDETKLRQMMESAETAFGPWKEHKPLQWNFATDRINGVAVLMSIKIVEYERGRVRYALVFRDDGKYERLIGIHSRTWKGTLPPGQY